MRVFNSFLFVFFLSCVASGQFFSNVTLPVDEKFSSDVQIEYTKGQVPRSYVVGKIRGVEYRYFHDNSQGIIEGTKGYGTDSVLRPDETKKTITIERDGATVLVVKSVDASGNETVRRVRVFVESL